MWFFLAFGVGLLMCYMFTPPPPVVVKFPSPSNVGKVLYRDADKNCFAYKAENVECTSKSKEQPIAIEGAK